MNPQTRRPAQVRHRAPARRVARAVLLAASALLGVGVAQSGGQSAPVPTPPVVRASPVPTGTPPEGWLHVTGLVRPTDRVALAAASTVTVQFHDLSGTAPRHLLTVEFPTRFLPAPYSLWVNPARLGPGQHSVTVYVRNRAGQPLYRGAALIERRELGRPLDIELAPAH